MFKRVVPLLLILSVLLTGCYSWVEVAEHEVGLSMVNGVTVDSVLPPGRYSKHFVWNAALPRVDVGSKTRTWEDSSVATSDKQIVKIVIGLSYNRSKNPEQITEMNRLNPKETYDDDALWLLVTNRLARSVKSVTTEFTLDQMMGTAGATTDRNDLANRILEVLAPELAKIGIIVTDLGVNDLEPSAAYLAALEARVQSQSETERIKTETLRVQEQLTQEQAETKIALEQASRDRLVAEEQAKVYEQNPQMLELRKAEIMAASFKATDKVYFLTEGTDISLFMGGTAPVVPAAQPTP